MNDARVPSGDDVMQAALRAERAGVPVDWKKMALDLFQYSVRLTAQMRLEEMNQKSDDKDMGVG